MSQNTRENSQVTVPRQTTVKVVGIGGCGCNTVNYIIEKGLKDVEFIAINTDMQSLNANKAPTRIQIGANLTRGLGAGCDPNKGRKAAEESREEIRKVLKDAGMVFVAAGMGNGTGTGAASIVAGVARELGAVTVGVVTRPFKFESSLKAANAEIGIAELAKHSDTIIVVDNNKVLKLGANLSLKKAFATVNDVLYLAVAGICDTINQHGFINVDYADVVTMMRGRGRAMIGIGRGEGQTFVDDAIRAAIHCPLVESIELSSATGMIATARVSYNFPISAWEDICDKLHSYTGPEADCKFGLSFDESLKDDEIIITIILTGISYVQEEGSGVSPAGDKAKIPPLRGRLNNEGIKSPLPLQDKTTVMPRAADAPAGID